jgi:hypothetical protein
MHAAVFSPLSGFHSASTESHLPRKRGLCVFASAQSFEFVGDVVHVNLRVRCSTS